MKAQQVESTLEEDRDRETVAYLARDEKDLEQILEKAHTVEDEKTAEAVETISDVVDDELRASVTNHFEAPIRSLNNPGENSVELEDGTEAQLVGEEYFVNQNLPDFQDVGNIRWWTVYDEGTYREETRWDGGGEHLQLDTEGELHGFHIELDGEPLSPERTQSLKRNLQARQDNQVTTRRGTPISELSDVPEMVLEHNNITEAAEASENYDEEDFESRYREAEELGLVTEGGNLTLKGVLSGADFEARDLRSLEQVVNGAGEIEFHSLNHETFPLLNQEDVLSYQASLTVSTDNRELSDPVDTTGRVENGEIESSLADEIRNINDALGHEIESVSEDTTETYGLNLADYLQTFENLSVSENVLTDDLEDTVAAEVAQAALRTDEPEVTSARIEEAELEFNPESELGHAEWSSALDYEIPELRKEIENNTTIYFEDGTLRLDYKGENSEAGKVIEGFRSNVNSYKIDDDEPIGSFSDILVINETYLRLQEVREDLEDHLRFDDNIGAIGRRVSDYDEVSESSKQKIDQLEDQGVIETEAEVVRDASFDITASNPLEYRELISELEEIDESLDYTEEPESSSQRAQLSLEHVYTEIESLVDEEEIREELDGFLSELIDLGMPASKVEEVEVKDYEKFGNNELSHKLNEFVDDVDNDYVTRAVRTLVDEPELVEENELKRVFSEMSGRLREYEVREHDTTPSEKLLERLEELYDKDIIGAKRVYEEPLSDFKTERFWYPDINSEVMVDRFLERDEEYRDKLHELDERGLIEFERPTRKLEINKNYGELDSLRFNLDVGYRLEELDIGESEVEVEVDHQTEGPYGYERNERIEEVAQAIDPLTGSEPYENIEIKTDFEYRRASESVSTERDAAV